MLTMECTRALLYLDVQTAFIRVFGELLYNLQWWLLDEVLIIGLHYSDPYLGMTWNMIIQISDITITFDHWETVHAVVSASNQCKMAYNSLTSNLWEDNYCFFLCMSCRKWSLSCRWVVTGEHHIIISEFTYACYLCVFLFNVIPEGELLVLVLKAVMQQLGKARSSGERPATVSTDQYSGNCQ